MLRHQDRIGVPPSALNTAMGLAEWPARLQHLRSGPLVGSREIWLDGGHNPSAAGRIASFVRDSFTDGKPLLLVFASLATKDPSGMLEPFRDLATQVHTVSIADHASFAPGELAKIAAELGFAADAHDSLEEAVAAAPAGSRVLIFGSLYLAGEVLAANGQAPD
jgi:dihydrofolate synthase/folylpolyglutamate synthase